MSEPSQPRSHLGLIVSLCVNLLLAGVIAMAAYRHFSLDRPMPPEPGAMQPQPPERTQVRQLLSPRFFFHIAPEKRDQIRDIAKAHRPRLDALKEEANTARRQLLEVFSAPQLDKAALQKALDRTQKADAAVEIEVMKLTAEVAPLLSAEERKKAAEWRSRHPGPFGMQWGGRHMPGPPDGPAGPDGPRPPDRD